MQWTAVIGGREFQVFVNGPRAEYPTSQDLAMHGVALDGQLALAESPLRAGF